MIWIGIAIYVMVMLLWSIYEMRRTVDMPDEFEEQTPQFEEDNTNLKNQNHDQYRFKTTIQPIQAGNVPYGCYRRWNQAGDDRRLSQG